MGVRVKVLRVSLGLAVVKVITQIQITTAKIVGRLIEVVTKVRVSQGLFYHWHPTPGNKNRAYRWPKEFALKFARARTTRTKAAVAIQLLKEVARTNGKILHKKK